MILLEPFLDETSMELLEVDGGLAELEEVGNREKSSIGLRLAGVAVDCSNAEAREWANTWRHGRIG